MMILRLLYFLIQICSVNNDDYVLQNSTALVSIFFPWQQNRLVIVAKICLMYLFYQSLKAVYNCKQVYEFIAILTVAHQNVSVVYQVHVLKQNNVLNIDHLQEKITVQNINTNIAFENWNKLSFYFTSIFFFNSQNLSNFRQRF